MEVNQGGGEVEVCGGALGDRGWGSGWKYSKGI